MEALDPYDALNGVKKLPSFDLPSLLFPHVEAKREGYAVILTSLEDQSGI